MAAKPMKLQVELFMGVCCPPSDAYVYHITPDQAIAKFCRKQLITKDKYVPMGSDLSVFCT
jgi:hypothetical protein